MQIFGIKTGDLVGGWRKMHSEEFQNVFFSPNIIIIIKSLRMRRT
jgi:hypothetical protein